MYCLNCGNKLNEGEKFCPMCGEAAPEESAAAESTQAQPQPEQPNAYDRNQDGATPTRDTGVSNDYPPVQHQYGSRPAPMYGQPPQQQQPQQGYPAFGNYRNNYPNGYGTQQFAPYGQGVAVKKKSKAPLIITLCCVGAAVIIALIVFMSMRIAHKSTLAGQLEGKWSTTYSGKTYTVEFKSDGTVDLGDLLSEALGSSGYSSGFDYSQLVGNLVKIKYTVDDDRDLTLSMGTGFITAESMSYSLSWSENAKSSSSAKWYLYGDTLYIAGQEFTRVG